MKFIYSDNWHKLTGQQIIDLFDETFGGSTTISKDGTSVSIQPNLSLVRELKELKTATLELLENREFSTVYRIRQSGAVYQITQPDGKYFVYEDYDDYLSDTPVDKLIITYIDNKTIKFSAKKDEQGRLWITHHQKPRFIAQWVGGLNGLDNYTWYEEPEPLELAKLLRKAGAFIANYF